jgi:MFS transporter, PAT family, beta-lactamase induction signal transducer AmpG
MRLDRHHRTLLWIGLLYFAEGFPFGIVYDVLPVYFRTAGVSLREIGLLSLLGLPWSFKALWSPLIDRFGERRHWIVACQVGMGLALAALPLFPPGQIGWALRGLLVVFATLSATQDIAVDAYTIGVVERGREGTANSMRVSAYRAALVLGGGGLVALAGVVAWPTLFWAGAAVFGLLAVVTWHTPRVRVSPEQQRALFRPLWVWLRRPTAPVVLIFVLIYKLGDASMGPMVKPFWIDRGLSPAEIGLISTTAGVIATVVGAILGGIWIQRRGIYHGLWALGLLQAVSNLGYAGVAHFALPRGYIYAASVFESFSGGLGTAAFLSFLMSICEKEHAAVQYALLSALFALSRSVAGGVSGWGTERLGYAAYFGLTFLLALPAYALLPWVRAWIRAPYQPPATNTLRADANRPASSRQK